MHSQKTVLSFSEVSQSLGFPTVAAAYVARKRGIFPVRVRLIGCKLVCFLSDLEEYLITGESQSSLSVRAICKQKTHGKKGRPSKSESIAAQKMGLTVSQMRASKRVEGV
ncbi:MAG TPA: hypothetical protein DE312_07485 [Gallionella sp.]|nr:MAG: hypothetical protein A2Z87_00290 [Gallionellales bacterium GWA2_54_124]OGT17925.1 MAG: hypothetical protein A2522_08635 [Gallionellales bacterium RIFOXYD12_FULL_53_10]HCI53137.1 hypothetical protein [Gallionella sp.]